MARPSPFVVAVTAAVVAAVGGAAVAASAVLLHAFPPAGAERIDLEGRWGSASASGPHLQLDADGRLGGYDGCNGFGGVWAWDAGTGAAVFGDVVVSLVLCPGVDQWLSGAAAAELRDGRLVLTGGDGALIGSLSRP